ncbi:Glutamate decarboxylase [Shigella dysenteriae 1617]|uniref:Glutamate decarboxylase n=1 Tax=Shigella dysenteriae 1617 TaxID=754093 RepID=A0A0A7A0S9_SHIDY|nr:Glutamate decarboxylase [Shigella dysenteriae 1617]
MAVTAAKSVMAFRVLTMAVDLCRLTTRTMNVNAGHERTSKARIIHQIQLIRGITRMNYILMATLVRTWPLSARPGTTKTSINLWICRSIKTGSTKKNIRNLQPSTCVA